ncbi:hypothetical protein BH10ACT3_BH10ACT3_14770 [soil metagenome]
MTEQSPSTQGPLAGGYLGDSTGRLRWWDGATWGPYAPFDVASPTVESAGKVLAVLSWVGFFAAYFVVALAVRVSEKNGNRFARWHAAEALNVQLTFVLMWNAILGPVFIFNFSTGDEPSAGLFIGAIGVAMLLFLGSAVLCVVGAIKASRGDWWRCNVSLPFLRLHRRERAAALATAPPLP